eukprot:TRINITY_DN3346_c0_g3_i1.p1 TRINITY_DN3346_c0_g3~~TRINITY_DN3346_c0_g3_i1.p1  ORF type:complete len:1094 (-),score=136.89 TRINITY_DN3346_c0_g3_i1:888-3734(-)
MDAPPDAPLQSPDRLLPPHVAVPSLSPEDLGLEDESEKSSNALLSRAWLPGWRNADRGFRVFAGGGFLASYSVNRHKVHLSNTSLLSPHFHFGEISVRKVYHTVHAHRTQLLNQTSDFHGSDKPHHVTSNASIEGIKCFLRSIGFREYSRYLIFQFPFTHERSLLANLKGFPWKADEEWFKTWRQGRTGYPLVDAGMRELWATGWLHNRIRVIVASFSVKFLRLPWRWGMKYFWDTLIDADVENDILGWQYVSGSLPDGHELDRMDDPKGLGKKYDADGEYVRRWIPELSRLPSEWIHHPWDTPPSVLQAAGVELGANYPHPIITVDSAREGLQDALACMWETDAALRVARENGSLEGVGETLMEVPGTGGSAHGVMMVPCVRVNSSAEGSFIAGRQVPREVVRQVAGQEVSPSSRAGDQRVPSMREPSEEAKAAAEMILRQGGRRAERRGEERVERITQGGDNEDRDRAVTRVAGVGEGRRGFSMAAAASSVVPASAAIGPVSDRPASSSPPAVVPRLSPSTIAGAHGAKESDSSRIVTVPRIFIAPLSSSTLPPSSNTIGSAATASAAAAMTPTAAPASHGPDTIFHATLPTSAMRDHETQYATIPTHATTTHAPRATIPTPPLAIPAHAPASAAAAPAAVTTSTCTAAANPGSAPTSDSLPAAKRACRGRDVPRDASGRTSRRQDRATSYGGQPGVSGQPVVPPAVRKGQLRHLPVVTPRSHPLVHSPHLTTFLPPPSPSPPPLAPPLNESTQHEEMDFSSSPQSRLSPFSYPSPDAPATNPSGLKGAFAPLPPHPFNLDLTPPLSDKQQTNAAGLLSPIAVPSTLLPAAVGAVPAGPVTPASNSSSHSRERKNARFRTTAFGEDFVERNGKDDARSGGQIASEADSEREHRGQVQTTSYSEELAKRPRENAAQRGGQSTGQVAGQVAGQAVGQASPETDSPRGR